MNQQRTRVLEHVQRRGAALGVGIFFALLLLGGRASADEVHLRNGGFVQGTIIEHDPSRSTRIQLPDGSVRDLPAASISYVKSGRTKRSVSTPRERRIKAAR